MIKKLIPPLSALCTLMFTMTTAFAIDNSISITTDRPVTFVGQEIIVSIVVVADELDLTPELPEIDGSRIHYVDSQVTDNDDKKAFMFRYSCTPFKVGELLIPPVSVKVGEVELSSTERKVEVLDLMKTDKLKLTTDLSSTKVYVGQPITLKFIWESKLQLNTIKALDLFLPVLSHQAFKNKDKKTNVNRTKRTIGIPVNNTRVIANSWETKDNDVTSYFLSFEKVLIPQASGTFKINSSRLICSAEKANFNKKSKRGRWNQYPSYFNNDFFANASDTKRWDRFIVKSEPVEIEVLPLPNEGKPASFNGIIGSFDLQVTVETLAAKVGTPVALKMTVKNHPYVETIDLPPLRTQSTLSHNFMVPKERSPGLFKENTKVFIQSVRPTSDKVKFIPSISVPYFDPTTQKYGAVKSEPIAIKVTPNDSFTEFDLDFADGSTIKSIVETNDVGIKHNYMDIKIDTVAAPFSIYDPVFFLIILITPLAAAALYFGISNYLENKRHTSKQTLAKRALKDFRKSKFESDAEIDCALRNYFAARFDQKNSTITFADMERLAGESGRAVQHLAPIKEFYSHYDYTNFAEETPAECKHSVNRKAIANAVKKINSAVKVTVVALSLMLVSTSNAAQAQSDVQAVYSDANELFELAHEMIGQDLTKGQQLYKNAAMNFEFLSDQTKSPAAKAQLLYNAGNAYYFAEDYGMSIYSYLMAEQFAPHDDNLQSNLEFLRSQRIDDFEKSDLTLCIENTFFWHYHFSSKMRLWLFYSLYLLLWIAIVVAAKKGSIQRSWIVALAVPVALIGCSILVHEFTGYGQNGVITAESVVARKGDNFAYDPAFNEPLHSGTEFLCLEKRGDWSLISLENGEQCWVQSDSIKLVNR